MKKYLTLLLSLLVAVVAFADDVTAARDLARRVLGDRAGEFEFRLVPKGDADAFTISADGGKVVISGNNANSMAVGLNHYLKYLCNTELGWYKDARFTLPEVLPLPAEPISVKARVDNRFFLNYCTFGYTMPWWKWEDWEHLIDWMALNGVNLPLAITGQESIWYKVWTELGIPDEEVRAYFTGPSHLPWHRMTNMDAWQGPLPQSWLDGQLELQQKITARERELNMRPVLPAFAGHVPEGLKKIYPDAKISKLSPWQAFTDETACSLLDPMDPLFPVIQKKFLEKQAELYGTDHIYGIDVFNEVQPPSWEPEYLGRVSRQVYDSLIAADPDATWLQMTWLFYHNKNWTPERIKAYITSFDAERQLLLDYYCERQEVWQRTDKFHGVPFIWCYLGNFGGNTMLVGNIATVNERVENTVANGGDGFRGVGSTLEGFDCNPFMHQYVFEKAWDFDTHKNLAEWTPALADRRVGRTDAHGRKAWQLLIDSVYVAYSSPGQCPMVNVRPCFGKYKTRYANPRIKYDNRVLISVLDEMLAAEGVGDTYAYDLTNITRQLLSNYFLTSFRLYEKAYNAGDRAEMNRRKAEMLSILRDLDTLLATQSAFLTGKWIDDARSWGVTDAEKDYYESNARNLITTWGDADKPLNDYASRTWQGLVSTFYMPRWQMFFDAVDSAMDRGVKFGDKADDPEFLAYKKRVCDFEKNWWRYRVGSFPATPQGDSREVAASLLAKYRDAIAAQPTPKE